MGSVPTIHRESLLELITQIVENIPNMVFVKDAEDLRFILFNRAGEDLLGHDRQDLLGRNDYDLFPEDQADFFTRIDRQVLDSGEVLDIPEEPIETPIGRRWLHTKKVPLFASDGTPRYLLGISEDITGRRRTEHMKDDLISVASHELRSPTAAMIGTLTLLETAMGPSLDADSREMLELAKENGTRMIELLDSCLQVGRLEQERSRLNVQEVDLGAVVREAVRLNQPFADRYSVRYVVGEIADPAMVRADPDRLLQALTNVMSNAAKFSPENERVLVSVTADDDGLRIDIADHGPGIPESFRARVFDKFARARTTESAAKEGSGLGLNIAKHLVQRMGGTIGFETVEGEGTTFRIALPRA